jgi:hypothetical protein
VKTTSMDKARAAWGEAMPDWVAALATECDRTCQREAGARLPRGNGNTYSAATVNQVLGNTYLGGLDAIEAAVRARIMVRTVHCCHLDADLSHEDCAARAGSPMPMSSPIALRAWQACRECPQGGSK